MHKDDFTRAMERLEGQWPGFYKFERKKMIYWEVMNLDYDDWSRIVDRLLQTCRQAPLPKEIVIETIKIREHKRFVEKQKEDSTLEQIIKCSDKETVYRTTCIMKIFAGTITPNERAEFDKKVSAGINSAWTTKDV